MHATTYLMLLEADLEKAKDAAPAKSKLTSKSSPTPSRIVKPKPVKSLATANGSKGATALHGHLPEGQKVHTFSPKLHIDVQIHISPDSSSEQIDKIFESMAKHLKDFHS